MNTYIKINDTPFEYFYTLEERLLDLDRRVHDMRRVGKLSPQVLKRIHNFFKIKGIYHSNALEGNQLTIGETRLVVEMGMTLTGKTLRDQAEATNLSHALDFMEEIAAATDRPLTLSDLRQIHALILKDIDNDFAGKYRTGQVKISGSDYKPPDPQQVPMEMDDLGEYVSTVTSSEPPELDLPILCAAAAHAWLAQIHPFVDGNGRTARILMNLILMRRGYPICIITREDRRRYIHALEESQASDFTYLIELIYENVEESLEEWEKAAREQRQHQEWLTSVTARFQQPELNRAHNEYEVWKRGMALFKGYFKQTVDAWNEQISVGNVSLNYRDYGELDFEKYLSLRDEGSAKRTWDFGIVFQRGERRVRYLFFYGKADPALRSKAKVVLLIAKAIGYEYGYESLKKISQPNTSDIYQVGFDIDSQSFVALTISGVIERKAEALARRFFEQVIERDFGA